MSARLAPLLLGILLAGYWGRVFRMAMKARQRTGRSAGLVPSERTGRWLRVIWTPVVLVWIANPLVAASRHPPSLWKPLFFSPAIAWTCLLISAGCLLLTLRCWRTMGRDWRMGIDPAEKTPLIAAGLFAYVRHPIYALSQVLMLASMVMVPSPLLLAAGSLHIILLQWESRREERHMMKVHGSAYAQYRSRVGRFVPAWRGFFSSVKGRSGN